MRVPHFGVALNNSVLKYHCCTLEKQNIFFGSSNSLTLQHIYIVIYKIFLTSYLNLDIWLTVHHSKTFLLLPT